MSVSRDDYIIYGVSIPMEHWNGLSEDRQEKLMDKYDSGYSDIALIVDGMNGEYAILGYVIHHSDHNDGGIPLTKMSFNNVPGDVSRVLQAISIDFGYMGIPNIGTFVLSHFS